MTDQNPTGPEAVIRIETSPRYSILQELEAACEAQCIEARTRVEAALLADMPPRDPGAAEALDVARCKLRDAMDLRRRTWAASIVHASRAGGR